ncbi:uncharacterized protein TNCT_201833 [Trichonephila clavata]|uniref:LIM zinc-binding domain-containing protein n=1 Tax=Trichonephila clavata TaxID=2740835 RepID=A0A8X6LL48_TRICU|nr:uncharacterized protein TNCT_201833 [Trichonephila clavata]
MSFEFKEDSPLTSPSDSNREIGEMLSPSQNVDVVEFFDPFCPVKEESPTDYYPNVMLGQTTLGEPLLDGLSEPQQFSTIDEPLLDNLSEPQQFSTSDEPLIDNLSEPPQFSNGFSNYEDQDDTNLLGSYQEEIPEITTEVIEDEDIPDHLEEEIPNESLSDICTNSDLTTLASSKSETSADVEQLTELEQIHSEETCISPVSEQVFDDSKHDISSQHEQSQIFEDDISRRGRTNSSASSHSSKSDSSEKKSSYKITETRKEETKTSTSIISPKKEIMKKEISTKKEITKTAETNGYSSHNGVDNTVSLKNSKNTELDAEKSSNCLASVTDLKTSFTKSNDDLQQKEFQEEVKPSVDRVKVQRTFSQSGQDEVCLCKICNKHVYQMEKIKAAKSVFHKNCFRCKECNKLLNIDNYSSNEGDIYCQPHFRQLFQPKARFDGEDAAPNEIQSDEGKQRRNEMIIRENIPTELPPDVVRLKGQLGSLMRNVQSDKVLYSEYCKGIKNYFDEGITDEATNSFISTNNPVFCLPHQVMIKNESLATKLRIVFDASAHKRTVFEKEMRLKTERCKIMQEQRQFKSERAKMLSVDPDAVARPVAIGEEKHLSRDPFNVPIISADEEMYKEKEETSVNVIKDKAKEDVNPVCVNSNLKASSNVILVPHHSCFNRKNSLDKRGVEKHALELYDFIKRFGIMRRRQALRERTKTTKAELRKRVRLKLRLSEYSQKLQNSVFKRRVQPEVTIMEICVVKEKRSLCGTKRNRVKRAQQRPLPWTASGEKLRGEIGTLNGKLPKSFIPQGENSCGDRESPPPLHHKKTQGEPDICPPPQTNTLEEEPRR